MPWTTRIAATMLLLPTLALAQGAACVRPLTSVDSLDTVVHLAVQPGDFGYLP